MRNLEELMPADTPVYMMPAWLGCLSWAIGKDEIVAAFRKDTGLQWSPARSPFEQMIDQSTGADWAFIQAFVLWVNENVWGSLNNEGPAE